MIKFSNFGKAQIAVAPSGAGGLSFTVAAGKGLNFPVLGAGDYFYGVFKDALGNREIVKVEARTGDAMTIAAGGRGLDGTTAMSWAVGDYFVAGLINAALVDTIFSPSIQALSPLAASADRMAYYTGAAAAALTSLTPYARTVLDDADAATARATLGIPAAVQGYFPAGTQLGFFNLTAPVGWTQNPSVLDHAVRITNSNVLGGVGAGSIAFTAAFKSQPVVGDNAWINLTTDNIPWHTHPVALLSWNGTTGGANGIPVPKYDGSASQTTGATGNGGGHSHIFTGTAINLAVAYVNMILATKN